MLLLFVLITAQIYQLLGIELLIMSIFLSPFTFLGSIVISKLLSCLFLRLFIYLFIFRERGREGEREGEKHQCVVASLTPPTGDLAHNQACALTGNQTSDPLLCRPALNPLSHTSQGTLFFKKFCFVTVVPIFPLLTPPPLLPHPSQSPPCCPCPWVLYENSILSERSQSQKPTYIWFHSYGSLNGKISRESTSIRTADWGQKGFS